MFFKPSFFKPAGLLAVVIVAGLLFVMDALIGNVVFLSLLVGIFQVVVGLPILYLKDGRRQRLRNISIFLGVLVMVIVMVNVNAYIAPLHADRLIKAIESYRAANGVYPQKLDDLVPKFIDHVPLAQYTIGGVFFYVRGGTREPPMLWYNPHGMDHRTYYFETRDWHYLGLIGPKCRHATAESTIRVGYPSHMNIRQSCQSIPSQQITPSRVTAASWRIAWTPRRLAR
jgi:hypothetical protein